jgi:glycosyltransferase involved in cell wall biosynthesis
MSDDRTFNPLVSIVINNYNYEKFLKEAIDSALSQTYPNIEVIVVDDGSTDDSRSIIASYGNQIIPVLKSNGGQASAFNAGFEASKGEIVLFLDSDDIFYSNKADECACFLLTKMQKNPLVMVYHLMEVIDGNKNSLNRYEPVSVWKHPPNLYDHASKYRFFPYPGAPTSGNAFSRSLLKRIFPIPERGEKYVNRAADNYLVRAAGLLGEVYGMQQVLASYRFHGQNIWQGKDWQLEEYQDFTLARDNFLNQKLQENNREPVVSFFDSMDAKYYYQKLGVYDEILKLGFKVLIWRVSSESIVFFVKAFIQYCLWSISPKLVSRWDKLNEK